MFSRLVVLYTHCLELSEVAVFLCFRPPRSARRLGAEPRSQALFYFVLISSLSYGLPS